MGGAPWGHWQRKGSGQTRSGLADFLLFTKRLSGLELRLGPVLLHFCLQSCISFRLGTKQRVAGLPRWAGGRRSRGNWDHLYLLGGRPSISAVVLFWGASQIGSGSRGPVKA